MSDLYLFPFVNSGFNGIIFQLFYWCRAQIAWLADKVTVCFRFGARSDLSVLKGWLPLSIPIIGKVVRRRWHIVKIRFNLIGRDRFRHYMCHRFRLWSHFLDRSSRWLRERWFVCYE